MGSLAFRQAPTVLVKANSYHTAFDGSRRRWPAPANPFATANGSDNTASACILGHDPLIAIAAAAATAVPNGCAHPSPCPAPRRGKLKTERRATSTARRATRPPDYRETTPRQIGRA